jgi:hypothetical protein
MLYLLNQFFLKTHFSWGFLHSYFNDFLLIPAALPLLLWLQSRLQLREHDPFPTPSEIVFHLLIWSLLFEVIAPHLIRTTGDPWDVVAYAGGGLLAWMVWRGKSPLNPI